MRSLNVVHVSDFHLCRDGDQRVGGELPFPNLRRVVASLDRSEPPPGLILLGGDIAHDGHAESYHLAQELLAPFQVPIAAVGGNHDSLRTMRSVLSTDEAGARELLDGMGWGLHLLETQIPGCEDGDITSQTLMKLEESLRSAGLNNHLVVMHHDIAQDPPGVRPGLRSPERVMTTLLGTPHRFLVLTGHRHMAMGFTLGHVTILGTPSTCVQFVSGADTVEPDPGTRPGYRRLTLDSDGSVRTSVVWL
jgi:Icc protein